MSKKLRKFLQTLAQGGESFGHGWGLFRFLFSSAFAIAAAELLNSSGGINDLLFAGKEGMTGRADFHMEFGSG